MAETSVTPLGFLGNLNATQEEKLRQFWIILIQSWDSSAERPDTAAKDSGSKGHRRWFSLGREPHPATEAETSAIPPNLLSSLKSLDTGPNELRTINSLLKKLPGDEIRAAYLTILKQDHPDGLCLRFLRAEDWVVPKAWIKFVTALHWRVKEYKVDEGVLVKGEEYAVEKAKSPENSAEKKDCQGFVRQLETGKGHFHGVDRWNRPICVVRVRFHNPHEQTEKGLNDYIVHCCETVRILQTPPVETMTIVFDLTAFSLSNWDFPPIKFIIKNFQENYPESLGAMIFYNAPWIFSGLWKLIHPLLDPVVAAKVHFISGAKDLERLIPREHIIKELGGVEDWEYKYIDPVPGENDKLRDALTREQIQSERKKLGDDLFRETLEWIASLQDGSVKGRRDETITQLRDNYWNLDPYVRMRTIMDRTGVIKGGGNTDFYPSEKAPAEEAPAEEAPAEEAPAEAEVEPKKMEVEHAENTAAAVTATA